MEPLFAILMWAVIIIAGFGAYKGYEVYYDRVLEPRKRFEALDELANKVAAHNLNYMLTGPNKKEEAKSGESKQAREPSIKDLIVPKEFDITKIIQNALSVEIDFPKYLSLSEALREKSPLNVEVKSAFKMRSREAFHHGPYAHELTDEEWDHVRNAYKDALQRMMNSSIHTESQVRTSESFEEDVKRELGEYVRARRELESTEEEQFANMFEQLLNEQKKERGN